MQEPKAVVNLCVRTDVRQWERLAELARTRNLRHGKKLSIAAAAKLAIGAGLVALERESRGGQDEP